jgi:hypothetical protein
VITKQGVFFGMASFLVASSAAAQERIRNYWQHSQGYYKQLHGQNWQEKNENGTFELTEVQRGPTYIELVSKSGSGTRIRLFDRQADVLWQGQGAWTMRYTGSWSGQGGGARNLWRHSSGWFRHNGGGNWTEKSQNGTFELREVERTAMHVELVSTSGSGTRIRLFDRQSDILRGGNGRWERQYLGSWADSTPTRERVSWRHAEGYFENTAANDWLEKSPNGTFRFTEELRTDQYIELRNIQSGTRVRLYADRCDVKSPNQDAYYTRYRGRWDQR